MLIAALAAVMADQLDTHLMALGGQRNRQVVKSSIRTLQQVSLLRTSLAEEE